MIETHVKKNSRSKVPKRQASSIDSSDSCLPRVRAFAICFGNGPLRTIRLIRPGNVEDIQKKLVLRLHPGYFNLYQSILDTFFNCNDDHSSTFGYQSRRLYQPHAYQNLSKRQGQERDRGKGRAIEHKRLRRITTVQTGEMLILSNSYENAVFTDSGQRKPQKQLNRFISFNSSVYIIVLKRVDILIGDNNFIIRRFNVLHFVVFRFVRAMLENFTGSFFHRSRTSGALIRRSTTSTACLRGSRSSVSASRYPRNEINMVGQT